MRKLVHGRLRPVAVVSIAVAGLLVSASAPALAGRNGEPSRKVAKLGAARAAAFALNVDADVLGVPVDVGPVARLRLSGDSGRRYENAAKVKVPPLVEALVLASGAETRETKQLRSQASSRAATVKLRLAGDLLLKVLRSGCEITKDGVEVESEVLFADGSVLGIGFDMVSLQARPNTRISIPAVGDLILNEQRVEKQVTGKRGRITATVNALRLELNGILGTGDITVAQSVCKLRGKDVGPELEVVSTTNGQDTSDQIDDHGDGILGGVGKGLISVGGGVGGVGNVNQLLGDGLLGGGLGGLL